MPIAKKRLEFQPHFRAAADRRDGAIPAASFPPAICHLSGAPAAMEANAERGTTVC